MVRVISSASVIKMERICVSFWASWYEGPTVHWVITDQYSAKYRAVYQMCEYDRYGYRIIAEMLNNSGWHVRHKRLEWIWRREGLKAQHK